MPINRNVLRKRVQSALSRSEVVILDARKVNAIVSYEQDEPPPGVINAAPLGKWYFTVSLENENVQMPDNGSVIQYDGKKLRVFLVKENKGFNTATLGAREEDEENGDRN